MINIPKSHGITSEVMEQSLREFKNKYPHLSKNICISYFYDVKDRILTKVHKEFRKRK